MLHRSIGVFLIAASTLMAEVVLVRVFEVLMLPHFAYMIVTAALLAFGVAGVVSTLRPGSSDRSVSAEPLVLAGALLALPFLINLLPFDYERIGTDPLVQLAMFSVLYVALATPFFFAGLLLARLFTRHAADIRRLYAWDLTGAALGSVLPLPLLALIGPVGLLVIAAGTAILAAAFLSRPPRRRPLALIALPFIVAPALIGPDRLPIREHADRRGLRTARELGLVERTVWDPVARVDVVAPLPVPWDPARTDDDSRPRRHIVYDGGSQSSYFYAFRGDLEALRDSIERRLVPPEHHFWFWGVLASHSLKRDTDQRVAVIGSAGGQEIKAALMYGASHVDGIELVGEVVRLGKEEYAAYTGDLLNHPRANVVRGEGRSFLRSVDEPYDIIQIFSNHTTSSLAQGAGAVSADYLHTREAYAEHFARLTADGILHVNHHLYPRIVSTAAAAWVAGGRTDFERHVLVTQRARAPDMLPTILVKMSPWTPDEVGHIEALMELSEGEWDVVERPGAPDDGFLPLEFFSGEMTPEVLAGIPYRADPATDDRPFFSFLRRSLDHLELDRRSAVDASVAVLINGPMRRGIPLDVAHLIVVGGLSILLAVLFVGIPLARSRVGRADWPGKWPMLAYFALLGAGFITIELTLLSQLVKVVGFPLHTFALVIFVMLAGAGLGSALADRLEISPGRRWAWPFVSLLAFGLLHLFTYSAWSEAALSMSGPWRAALAGIAILPLAVSLGVPLPLGVLWAKERHEGAVAWGWAMNGLFTAAGGVGSAVLALLFGLRFSFAIALGLYAVAYLMFAVMRKAAAGP